MSVEIPVTFTHNKKEYKGHLSEVKGAGGHCWHLMINKRYCGQLLYNDAGWAFWPPPKVEFMKEFEDYFVSVVVGWYG